MKAQDLRTKSVEELNNELVNLLGEQFKLRMQTATGQLLHQSPALTSFEHNRCPECRDIDHAVFQLLSQRKCRSKR